ncbi:MATE family efflux transporter [Marispirochaeta aestuarii]|uniref:MATE family efflux transporter n=1 Tax=Marispirochaeta aestuarii TaxID=1963862 RepID=UPI0029C88F39|nr:MATE family efflux transporter [Marispirochaeta aestuarii]
MDKTQRIELLRSGEIGTALRTLAIPAATAMMVNAIYNVVDTAFIGMLNDTAAIGAAAILFPIFMLIGAIGLTFGMGSASLISRQLGEQNVEGAISTASTAFYSTLIIGVTFAIFGNIYIEEILILFGATDTILDRAVLYGRIIIGGSFFQILNMCMNNLLRAEGAARYSSIALITGGVLNIIFDPVFMFVLDFGLAGAALATISAQMVSTLYLLYYFLSDRGVLKIRLRDFSPRLGLYRDIMTIGLPTFFRQVLTSIAMGMFNNAAAAYGDPAVAAIGIVMRVVSLLMMAIFGIGQGLQPLAGYNFGARQFSRVIDATKKALTWSTVFAGCMAAAFFVFARWIVLAFSQDPEVVTLGVRAFRFLSTTMIFVGSQVVFSTLFQALGKGRQAGVLAVARQGLFFIPLVLILPRLWGLNGVFLAQPVADILAFIVTAVLAAVEMAELKKIRETREVKE